MGIGAGTWTAGKVAVALRTNAPVKFVNPNLLYPTPCLVGIAGIDGGDSSSCS